MADFDLICASTEAAGLQSDAQEISIVPAGEVETSNGSYLMDNVAAQITIKAFTDHGTDRPVDFEHSTLTKGQAGERADACGWIKQLRFDADKGLLARIEWNDEGRDAISTAKYRYISPVIVVRRRDRRVVALHSAALTNVPAIPRLQALAASQPIAKFLETLALQAPDAMDPPGPTGRDVGGEGTSPAVAAASNPQTVALVRSLLGKIRDALGLDEKATAQEVYAALGEFIEAAAQAETNTTTMRTNVRAELEQELLQERELEDLLATAARANKLHPRNKIVMQAARDLAGQDFDSFRVLLDSLPSVIAPGRITPRAGTDATDTQASAVAGDARAEFRANRAELSKWTDEEAFVAMKLREHSQQTSR